MFSSIVFVSLMLMLFLAGGAVLHMGMFKSHKEDKGSAYKAFTGIGSYGLSALFWFFCYSHHYLGW